MRGEHFGYASAAATGLASTPDDLTKFVRALVQRKLMIESATLKLMRQPAAFIANLPIWGLGTILYAPDDDGVYVFGHSGQNEPAINTDLRINPSTNDAVIVLSTGNGSIATRVGFLWTFWQIGRPDFFGLPGEAQRILPLYLGGILVLFLGCVVAAIFVRRRNRGSAHEL